MAKRKRILVAATATMLCVLTPILCGCWSSREPKDLAIVNSIVLDYDDTGLYSALVEIVNPAALNADGGGNASSSHVAFGHGTAITEALGMVSSSLERELYAKHNKVRFMTESMASTPHAVYAMFDYLMRGNLGDERPLIFVMEQSAKELVYKTDLGTAGLLGDRIQGIQSTQKKVSADSGFVTCMEFMRDVFTEGKEPVTGLFRIKEKISAEEQEGESTEKAPTHLISMEGLAVFKEVTYLGFLEKEETNIYNLLVNKAENMMLSMQNSGKDGASVTLNKPSAKVAVTVENGRAKVAIDVKSNAMLDYFNKEGVTPENMRDALKSLEKEFNSVLKTRIEEAVMYVQTQFASDIFGFGEHLHAKSPKVWKVVKEDWNEAYFAGAELQVTAEVTISVDGHIETPFLMR